MSPLATEISPSRPVISPEKLLFDFPEADLILCSRDSYQFRVLKLYIVNSSPMLGDKVLLCPNPQPGPGDPADSAVSNVEGTTANVPGVVQLPIEGAILFSLLTYIFPVPPLLPSTVDQVMELLSVAQTYKMEVVLTHIRNHIARQEPSFIREDTAFLIYSLSQKHGLRTEALQAARCTLNFSLTIWDLAETKKLDMMPGAILHELWKYHQRVRSNLRSEELRKSNLLAILGDLKCDKPARSGLPSWLESFISDLETARVPDFLDFTDLHIRLLEHIAYLRPKAQRPGGRCSSCSCITRKEMPEFCEALTATVCRIIAKAEPDFVIPAERTRSEGQDGRTRKATSPPKYSNMLSADVTLQSSDLVHFRVHKSALIASSPFFADMFSLPQPPNDAALDELSVVHLSEDSEVLNSLISFLYPVHPEIPDSSDNILALLAAATKYDMDAVQLSIRAEVNRRGSLSSTGAFRVYAVARSKGLIPEFKAAARLTLGYPLTFESLGDDLWLFDGWALRDLADFRRRSIRNLSSNWETFLDCLEGPSKIWADCPTAKGREDHDVRRLPSWLDGCLRLRLTGMLRLGLFGLTSGNKFTEVIPTSVQLCDTYMKALQSHVKDKDCNFCMKVHILEGENFCAKMKDILAEAWNLPILMSGERPGTPKMVYNSSE